MTRNVSAIQGALAPLLDSGERIESVGTAKFTTKNWLHRLPTPLQPAARWVLLWGCFTALTNTRLHFLRHSRITGRPVPWYHVKDGDLGFLSTDTSGALISVHLRGLPLGDRWLHYGVEDAGHVVALVRFGEA